MSILPERRVLRCAGDAVTNIWAALVSAVNSGAKRVYVPKPDIGYLLMQPDRNIPLTIPEGVIVESDDEDVLFSLSSFDGLGMLNQGTVISLSSNSGLIGVRIAGPTTTRSALRLVSGNGINGAILRHLVLSNAYSQAIQLIDCRDCEISSVRTNGRAYASVRIGGASSGIRVIESEFYSDRGFGVQLTGTSTQCEVSRVKSFDNGLETVGLTVGVSYCRINEITSVRSGDNGISITGFGNIVENSHVFEAYYNGVCLYGQGNIADEIVVVNCGRFNSGKTDVEIRDYSGVSITPAFGGVGRKNQIGRLVAIDTQPVPTMQYQVQLKTSGYTAWSARQVVSRGAYRANKNIVYVATSNGTTGVVAPTHTVGTASDGTVSWQYVNAAAASIDTVYPAIWSAGKVVVAGQIAVHILNRYRADMSGTTGFIPPTHTTNSVSDGGVSWTFVEQFAGNLDAFDNVVARPVGTPGAKGAVKVPKSNKNTIQAQNLTCLGASGRNLCSDLIAAVQMPSNSPTMSSLPGSPLLRRIANGKTRGRPVKDSCTGSARQQNPRYTVTGNSAERPVLTFNQAGAPYYDETLGKTIWWAGTLWIDETGTMV